MAVLNNMALLNTLSNDSVKGPTGMWESLVGLFNFIANYGWRIILFTVLLKLVLSPLDFFQKYKMKKNQRITEALQPEINKLKRQYANDKTALQQQQMKLQKAAGFSYFSSCIPVIVTMVIFITFFMGMRNISQYEEFKQYVQLYDTYSSSYTRLTGLDVDTAGVWNSEFDDKEFRLVLLDWEADGRLSDAQAAALKQADEYKLQSEDWYKQMYADWLMMKNYVRFFNANPVLAANPQEYNGADFYREGKGFDIDILAASSDARAAAAKAEVLSALNSALVLDDSGTGRTSFASFDEVYDDYQMLDKETELGQAISVLLTVAEVESAELTYDYYAANRQSFLWVKSLWVADVPWKDAVPKFSTFRGNVSKYINSTSRSGLSSEVLNSLDSETTYNKVMLKIREDDSMSGRNGLLLFAVLSVGLSLLSQFINTRQQRKSGQMATVSGNMKMVMYIMPFVTAIFAIMYTAAFAVYMITNSLMTLAINLLSSFVLGLTFRAKQKKELSDTGVVRYGRRDPNDIVGEKSGGKNNANNSTKNIGQNSGGGSSGGKKK